MTALPDEDIRHLEHSDTITADTTTVALTTALTRGAGPRMLPRLTVTGLIDMSTVTQFTRAVQEATAAQKVLLDLTRAEFVSSTAISVLFARRASFAAVLVGADSIVARALSAAGFPTIPTHTPTPPW